jgi:hypothetical protein
MRLAFSHALAIPVATALLAIAVVGCERPATQALKAPDGTPLKMPVPKSTTPEGKLARVVDRLTTALENAKPAAGSGVVSTRTASSRMIEPSEPGGPLTAEITIQTIVSVDQATAEQMSKTAEQKIEARRAAEPAFKPIEEDGDQTDELASPAAVQEETDVKPVDPKTLTKPLPRESVFQLVYTDDRWRLATELTADQATERICFEYALEE